MTMSTTEMSEPTPDPADRLAGNARALMLAVMCLLVVLVVMAFSLVYATTIAATAQDSAERQERLNDQLREELACRAQGATDFDLAKGAVIASLGMALVHLSQGADLAQDEAVILTAVEALNAAGERRQEILDECAASASAEG